jgi:transposase-like protein
MNAEDTMRMHARATAKEAGWLATHDGMVEVPIDTGPRLDDMRDVTPGPDAVQMDADGKRYARLFHGTPATLYDVQKERPIHRLAALLCATGMSFTEIGKRLDVNPNTVSNWFRQTWFQEYVDQEIRAAGLDPLKNLLQGAAKDSVLTLVELRDDPKVPASTRAKCASDLLDRAYGKAPAVVHHTHGATQAMQELAAVEREIGELLKSPEMNAAQNGGVA